MSSSGSRSRIPCTISEVVAKPPPAAATNDEARSLSGTGPQTALLEPSLRELAHVLRLQPLRSLHHVEFHLLALGEGAETIRLDGSVVAEHVLTTAVLRDEAEPLRIVEPLHSSSCHLRRHPSVDGPAEIAGTGAGASRTGARGFLRTIASIVNHIRFPTLVSRTRHRPRASGAGAG